MARLARLLHCVGELVACPISICAEGDSITVKRKWKSPVVTSDRAIRIETSTVTGENAYLTKRRQRLSWRIALQKRGAPASAAGYLAEIKIRCKNWLGRLRIDITYKRLF